MTGQEKAGAGRSPLAARLRENANISALAANVPALDEHPGFRASLEQDNALLTEAANALDEAKSLLMRVYRDEDDYRTNGWFMRVERLYPEEFPRAFSSPTGSV